MATTNQKIQEAFCQLSRQDRELAYQAARDRIGEGKQVSIGEMMKAYKFLRAKRGISGYLS